MSSRKDGSIPYCYNGRSLYHAHASEARKIRSILGYNRGWKGIRPAGLGISIPGQSRKHPQAYVFCAYHGPEPIGPTVEESIWLCSTLAMRWTWKRTDGLDCDAYGYINVWVAILTPLCPCDCTEERREISKGSAWGTLTPRANCTNSCQISPKVLCAFYLEGTGCWDSAT